MKKLKYLFTAIAVIAILAGCKENNPPQSQDDSTHDDPPAKVTTAKITFSNQSEDTYIVVVESHSYSDQFEIKGNKNVTKTYTLSSVIGYDYIIRLKQKDGYMVYPTEHTFHMMIEEGGAAVCWNNDRYWIQ